MHTKKRLILALDGTWQDGTSDGSPELASNVFKLAQAVNREDENGTPQFVYYDSGIGSFELTFGIVIPETARSIIQGATGLGMAQKVKEAYHFILRNWNAGDEIFIFGFSRGAYTARTIAALIGDIGVLGKEDQQHFWEIYEMYQLLGSSDSTQRTKAETFLTPWRNKKMEWEAENLSEPFTVKVLGVFDTVGALGVPGFVPKQINLFGFNDVKLGRHIQFAFHAMALNEDRKPFQVTKWEFDDSYQPAKNQTVVQVWFAGAHSNIGGGLWPDNDLSVISLLWMASKVKDMLGLDLNLLLHDKNFQASRPWGKHPPHDPIKESVVPQIELYTHHRTEDITLKRVDGVGKAFELIHPSVLEQDFSQVPIVWPQKMQDIILGAKATGFVEDLDVLEQMLVESKFQPHQMKEGGVGPLPDYGPLITLWAGIKSVLKRLKF